MFLLPASFQLTSVKREHKKVKNIGYHSCCQERYTRCKHNKSYQALVVFSQQSIVILEINMHIEHRK